MGVEEGPDELAADVFQTKFEMRVLVNGVMSAEKVAAPMFRRCLSFTSSGPIRREE